MLIPYSNRIRLDEERVDNTNEMFQSRRIDRQVMLDRKDIGILSDVR